MTKPAPSPSSTPRWPIALSFRSDPPPLAALIESEFTGAQLRELARTLGLTVKSSPRAGLVDQITEALTERIKQAADSPEMLLEGLDPEQRDFARRLLTARDHELPFSRQLAIRVGLRASEREPERRLSGLIEALQRRALLFPTRAYLPGVVRDVYYCWLPLDGRVPVVKWDVKIREGEQTAPCSVLSAQFLESFNAFLDAVMQSGITLRAPLPPHQQAARLSWLRDWEHDADEVERVLRSRPNWVPDPRHGLTIPLLGPITDEALAALENQTGLCRSHIEFLFAVACALQLIEAPTPGTDTAQHVHVQTSAVEEWLVLSPPAKLQQAWQAWSEKIMSGLEAQNASAALRADRSFCVMRAIGARYLTPSVLAAEWCALRRFVVRVLRGVPAGRWVDWDDLLSKLFAFHPECAWTFTSPQDWWFAFANGKTHVHLGQADEWRHSVGAVIEHVIRDSLVWFGAVQAQLSDDGRLSAFRITELGEILIGARTGDLPAHVASPPRSIEPIEWLDEHTLRVPPAPDRAALINLLRQTAKRGHAPFTYAFTPASIERALSQGITLEQLTAQFQKAGVSLPQTLLAQFELIARRHGRVRVYQSLTVLELSDDFAAKELAASTSLMKHVVYQLSPRAFVLDSSSLAELVGELQASGFTPRVK